MKDILPDNYFNNLKLLVTAIYHLNKDSISNEDLNSCELLLTEFHQRFIELYGKPIDSITQLN